MKTKTIVLFGAAVLVTLSFTFAKVNKPGNPATSEQSQTVEAAPAGGFAAEEIVK